MTTIIYIATEKYIELFLDFYRNVCKLEGDFNLILLTNKTNNEFISDSRCPIIKIQHIDHLPWPLPTLLKFHYIESVLDYCSEKVVYVNANFRFNESVILENNNLLNLSYMDTEKYEKCRTWPSVNEFNPELRHVLGGFFYAKKEIMVKVCKDIIWNINRDLLYGTIAPLHDETALNRYYQRFTDKCSLQEVHRYGNFNTDLYCSGQRFKPFIPSGIKY